MYLHGSLNFNRVFFFLGQISKNSHSYNAVAVAAAGLSMVHGIIERPLLNTGLINYELADNGMQ
jgi:hypothetical protein